MAELRWWGKIWSGKGNHRLRKYVATMIAEKCGIPLASQYLRHASEAVSLENYIAKRKEKLPVVTDAGLRAWSGAV